MVTLPSGVRPFRGGRRARRAPWPALAIALVLALPAVAAAQQGAGPMDLVVSGGVVHTLDPACPRASAVAVRGGRIAGLAAGALPPGWIGPGTRSIRLAAGACVVPGLWDAHGHLLSLGLAMTEVDLTGSRTYAEVVARVRARAAELPAGEWVLGRGWDQNDWPREELGGGFPSHGALTAATPRHPVLLERVDGHAVLCNALALQRSGIDAATVAPSGGEVVRDERGEPTGVLVDAAVALAAAPDVTPARRREALRLAARACLQAGLVGVHDAGVDLETVDALSALYAEEDLALRVYVLLTPEAAAARYLERGPALGLFGGRLTVRAIKHHADGALGSRGALLLEPYADRPDTRGLAQEDAGELERATREALARGFQVCTHAIGDAGVRRVLDAYEAALATSSAADPRLRVEHAQVVSPPDVARFARLGVIPSMQPTHATSDMPWAEARLGPARVRGAYAWRTLLDAGVRDLALGSDFPVEAVSPLLGLYAATTRLAPDGTSPHGPGGWFPGQRLTPEEALAGFTRSACHAAFLEADGGTISVGKWADLTVLSHDVLAGEPSVLLATDVLWTIAGGRVAFECGPDVDAPPGGG